MPVGMSVPGSPVRLEGEVWRFAPSWAESVLVLNLEQQVVVTISVPWRETVTVLRLPRKMGAEGTSLAGECLHAVGHLQLSLATRDRVGGATVVRLPDG